MRRLIWIILPALLVASCGDSITAPPSTQAFETIRQESYSAILTPRNEVIRDQQTWQSLWPAIWGSSPAPPPPAVDFSRESVVLAAMGETPDACFRTHIVQIAADSSRALIQVEHRRPPPSCVCPAVIGHPVHVVRTERLPAATQFSSRQVVTGDSCK